MIRKWQSESEAVRHMERDGWALNSYRGSLGITFHRGGKSITIFRSESGYWLIAR